MGNLPPGEICVGPIEDSANGKVMVRGRAGEYHLESYAVLTWEDGVLVEVDYHDKEIVPQLIGNLDKKHSRIIGELGIGFNPTADPSADILESEKSAVHIARGPQMDMGSVIQAEDHLDFLVLSGQVYGIDAAGVKHPIYPPEIREIR
jgi:leucyl aminopeptidase (aminopeptidase T)